MDNIIKFCVVGAGTAGAINMLGIVNAMKRHGKKFKITCIYDPNKPTIQVGESSSSPLLSLLCDNLNFKVLRDLPEVDGTIKYGVRYLNWTKDGDFYVYHGSPAIQFNSQKFSFWALKQFKELYPDSITEIHDTVKDIVNLDSSAKVVGDKAEYIYDYVIDCRGFVPDKDLNDTKYILPEFVSVNSVILYPELKQYNEMYTTSQAHQDGWMFGIPLTYRKTFGYLYNNTVTPFETARQNFKELKSIPDDLINNLRNFSWTPYYKKDALDGNILSSGNRSFFFEPSQAFSLHHYLVLADVFVEGILSKESPRDYINQFNQERIDEMLDVLAFNYQANTDFTSEFWKYVKQVSNNRLKKSTKFTAWVKSPKDFTHYAAHPTEFLDYLKNGMNINLSNYE
jgi:hypothetical protein